MKKQGFLKTAEKRAGFAVLKGVNAVARRCPERAVAPLGRLCGRTVWRLSRRYRNVAINNLTFAFGSERTSEEIETLARSVFDHFGRVAVEFFWLQRVSRERLDQIVELPDEGRQALRDARGNGKGAIVITAHFGNWELLGRYMAQQGYPLTVIARDSDDPTQAGFINSIRAQAGTGIISRGENASAMLDVLRDNGLLGILPDQNTAVNPIFVPFFGKPASTAPGVGVLALRSGAPVIPGFATRTATGWRIDSYPTLDIPAEGSLKERVLDITANYTRTIEAHIRKHPEQWLWFHDRWRTRPENEEGTVQ